MASDELPTLRWGIIATGLISSWFVTDLTLPRTSASAHHTIQAIGSSSLSKGQAFVSKHLPTLSPAPTIYGTYSDVYADPNVDIIYIGTPHAFHLQNCLDAIRHGKHVLCEKTFTLNVAEAKQVFSAAREKGVFVMEAMWTRFFPLVTSLQKLLHEEKAIGRVQRVFCDFAMDQHLDSKGPDSRLKDLALGASSLLDIGIYSLTWGIIGLEPPLGDARREAEEKPKVVATSSLVEGVDVATSMILRYEDGRQAIATSHSGTGMKTPSGFCRIEGSGGTVVVHGPAAPVPEYFVVRREGKEEERVEFERVGRGFYWEADAVAGDVGEGRKEDGRMPWAETVRVMELLDEVRRQGGVVFPQDKE